VITSPFELPEAKNLFAELLVSLTAESDRGAILVGAAQVDNCLRDLFSTVFPADLGEKQRYNMLAYSGALSTFSAKLHVAYATRLIPRSTYNAANALRRIRNEAAHFPATFSLSAQTDRIRQIYSSLGATVPDGLRALTVEMLVRYKVDMLLDAVRKTKEHEPELDVGISTADDALQFIRKHPAVLDAIEHQLPTWELTIGIFLVCSVIIMQRVRLSTRLGPSTLIATLAPASTEGQGTPSSLHHRGTEHQGESASPSGT
jgi:hypothetical protein